MPCRHSRERQSLSFVIPDASMVEHGRRRQGEEKYTRRAHSAFIKIPIDVSPGRLTLCPLQRTLLTCLAGFFTSLQTKHRDPISDAWQTRRREKPIYPCWDPSSIHPRLRWPAEQRKIKTNRRTRLQGEYTEHLGAHRLGDFLALPSFFYKSIRTLSCCSHTAQRSHPPTLRRPQSTW